MAEFLRSHGAKCGSRHYTYKFYDVDDGPHSILRAYKAKDYECVKALVQAGKHDINLR